MPDSSSDFTLQISLIPCFDMDTVAGFLKYAQKHRRRHDRIIIYLSILVLGYPAIFYVNSIKISESYVNIFDFLLFYTGYWTVFFYFFSYLSSPLQRLLCQIAIQRRWERGKRLSDWNFFRDHRRMFGLMGMHLLFWHFIIYFYLELGFIWEELVYDVSTRYFLMVGSLAFVIMMILSATSFKWPKKKLKKNWQRIHNTTNILALMIVIHIFLVIKTYSWYHYMVFILFGILFLERLYQYSRGCFIDYADRLNRSHK